MAHHHQHQDHNIPFTAQSHDADHHHPRQQKQISYKPADAAASGGSSRGNQQPLPASSEDEPRFGDQETATATASPWHRMKWTDDMVRLLIMVVFYMGDDAAAADHHNPPPPLGGKGKKVSTLAAQQQQQQKKGKWKSVSRAMMEKGFYVSPQQCEDKFNDLNKRYKRVNEVLGKGTACHVVENHALLDSMDHLPPNAKQEARKLLNSKHLFFQEMCAYHNSAAAAPTPEREGTVFDEDDRAQEASFESQDDNDGYCFDDDEDDEFHHEDEGAKRAKLAPLPQLSPGSDPQLSLSLFLPRPASMQQLRSELVGLAAGREEPERRRRWLRMREAELEEQRVVLQSRALQLERQRFKWMRFSSGKEREMERMRLENDRLRLENERMLLLLRQKEIELVAGGGGSAAASPAVNRFQQ